MCNFKKKKKLQPTKCRKKYQFGSGEAVVLTVLLN